MVEYYEGFLMAVDSLKRTGTSIDLFTYSTGPSTSSLNSILSKNEMKDMDIIFGPLHQQHIKPLADFADKHDIRLVIPFTSKDNTVFRNPSVYQINTPPILPLLGSVRPFCPPVPPTPMLSLLKPVRTLKTKRSS